MKRLLFSFIISSLLCLCMAAQELTVASYNIRYKNNDDSVNGNGWHQRCQSLCNQIRWERPDIFGTQEALHTQIKDLEEHLPEYRWIGVGRDDGQKKGEYAAIFYHPARIELIEEGHFWLNETPDRPALGWDAACIRICTWGHFRDCDSQKDFFFFNLHMDHVGAVARSESARLVMQRISAMTGDGKRMAVLTGDFNVSQNDSLYSFFVSSGVLKDCYTAARHRFAENGTYNGFHGHAFTDERIDHLFVSPNTIVENYAILTDSRWQAEKDGKMTRRTLSDHYPVLARIRF